MKRFSSYLLIAILVLILPACKDAQPDPNQARVLAVETFLADITRDVAGDRLSVASLIPAGVDPHAFEPTPKDVARVADSKVLVINGGGLESWIQRVLDNAGGERLLITASQGLTPRIPKPGEVEGDLASGTDPHFWLDPNNIIQFVENIRAGLSQYDPAGSDTYTKNAQAYTARLKDLDAWIQQQIDTIPSTHRLLITNHEEFGYYADRYGLTIIGTIIPSFTTNASPSAQELAQLSQKIRAAGAPAIFLEVGSNQQLARQLADETGVQVVTDLYTHSTTGPGGPAPTYIDMMRYNTNKIVNALK